MKEARVCIAAMLKDEERFLDEWLIYHRLLGVEHFFLYDDDPRLRLLSFIKPHAHYVTVVPWYESSGHLPGRNRQVKAYLHAVENFAKEFDWIAFIDGDEFIVLREHDRLHQFLGTFEQYGSISLTWHVFGHSGYFNDPPGLITESLTRRKVGLSDQAKSITRPSIISDITSVHHCSMLKGWKRVDANKRLYSKENYPGKSDVANINHYQCRSFLTWMKRAELGNAHDDEPAHRWRKSQSAFLKKFINNVSVEWNESSDEYMLKYAAKIKDELRRIYRPD